MKNKLKITRLLIMNAILIVSLILVFVITTIFLTSHHINRLSQIDTDLEVKLKLATDIANIARERSSLMLSMYNENDSWKIDEQFQRFHKLSLNFITLRNRLVNKGLSAEETEVFNSALQLIKITEPLQNDIVDRIQSGELESAGRDISQKDIPMEIELLGIFDQLHGTIIDTSFKRRNIVQQEFIRLIGFLAILSVLIVLVLIIIFSRSLKKIQKIELDLLLETESLSWDATHDPLTNIYNRRWLKHKTDILLENNNPAQPVHSLIYMDLDGFKGINDKHGHIAGDKFLNALCREIELCVRQNDTFARVGGDEFAILLENCGREKSLDIAEHILKTINDFAFDYEGRILTAGCSIGVYQFEQQAESFEKLIKHADQLCYQSKKSGKNRITSN
jgi:diguanylate cyclase (GGDEF)-like protein